MTTMTHPLGRLSKARHHPAITAMFVVFFWTVAAAAVSTAYFVLGRRSSAGEAVATIAALLLTAFCYTRFVAPYDGITHALGVGIAWLVLAIAAEMAVTAHIGHPWTPLIGSPDRPLLRNIFLFAWIFAPALFARREEGS